MRLFKVAAGVAVCSCACTSYRGNIDGDLLADALDIACELMDVVTEALEGSPERIVAAAHEVQGVGPSAREGADVANDLEHQPA